LKKSGREKEAKIEEGKVERDKDRRRR